MRIFVFKILELVLIRRTQFVHVNLIRLQFTRQSNHFFSNGFVEINQIMEMICLTYLLEYEVEKITGFQIGYNESHEQNSEATKKKR